MPRKGAQAKAFAAQQAKKREAEKQEARAKIDAEKNNAKGISECRDVGQLMRMHRANSERIEHMEEALPKNDANLAFPYISNNFHAGARNPRRSAEIHRIGLAQIK